MRLEPEMFKILLEQMDCEEMAQHPRKNHHVDGMDYLCLSRTDKLTIKLYMMGEPKNPNGLFLVNPHSHRYAFASILLAGGLYHVRFAESEGKPGDYTWDKYEYDSDAQTKRKSDTCGLTASIEICEVGDCYFVDTHEIHTLCMRRGAPIIIGLMQFSDSEPTSELYLPSEDAGYMKSANTYMPSLDETRLMRLDALSVLAGK